MKKPFFEEKKRILRSLFIKIANQTRYLLYNYYTTRTRTVIPCCMQLHTRLILQLM